MKKIVHTADSRGQAEHGWLSSRFSFSFAEYYNPNRMHFGVLRVLNDDVIKPGKGFGMHPHDNMEIVTIPLGGALEHRDSMGNGSIIKAGEIQLMSAGTGVRHSEFNPLQDEESSLLQIWLFPKERNIEPRYFQKEFDLQQLENRFRVVVSPEGEDESLIINQDAWFNLGKFDQGHQFSYQLKQKGNGMYIFVIDGSIMIAGETLNARDAIGIHNTEAIEIEALEQAYLLLMEVPMR
jgi:quercetin 2,3-dioxygenase